MVYYNAIIVFDLQDLRNDPYTIKSKVKVVSTDEGILKKYK